MMIRKSLAWIAGLVFMTMVAHSPAYSVTLGPFDMGTLSEGVVLSQTDSISGPDTPFTASYSFTVDTSSPSLDTNIEISSFLNNDIHGFISLIWEISSIDMLVIDSGVLTAPTNTPLNPLNFYLSFLDGDIVTIDFAGTTLLGGGALNVSVAAVPIPAAGILFGTALVGIGFISRRRRKVFGTRESNLVG